MTKPKRVEVILSHLYSIAAILLCLYLGKALHLFVGGLPASIYGMILFALLLQSGIVSAKRVSVSVDVYVKYMVIVYIPAVVGIMEFGALIHDSGGKILLIAVFTTLSGIVIAGKLSQRIFREL